MADVIGLSDVSTPDTGKGSEKKTGNLKRSYNMAKKCPKGRVWNTKLKQCIVQKAKSKLRSSDRIGEFDSDKDWYKQWKKEGNQ